MSANRPIYLDYNSTTPVDDRVLEKMLPYFSENFGNASSSTHSNGWIAADAVEIARGQVANLLHVEPSEIVFTSGATESINLAIKGVWQRYHTKGKHIVVVATEHKAVLDCCVSLEELGAEITRLSVDEFGLVKIKEFESAIRSDTVLVAVMLANNETGVIQPVSQIAEIVHEKNCVFLCDATQAIGKIEVDVQQLGLDLVPISSHKIYGPKGAGALYVRRKSPRVSLTPLIEGGGHERGLRSGTLNVPGIVGLGMACEVAQMNIASERNRIALLRNMLLELLEQESEVHINGVLDKSLPNTLNVSFGRIIADRLLKTMVTKVSLSTGSACTSALKKPSHVLKAMGLSDERAYGSVRFSLGRFTTEEEIKEAASIVIEELQKLKVLK